MSQGVRVQLHVKSLWWKGVLHNKKNKKWRIKPKTQCKGITIAIGITQFQPIRNRIYRFLIDWNLYSLFFIPNFLFLLLWLHLKEFQLIRNHILWNTQFLIGWNSYSLFSVPCSFYCAKLQKIDINCVQCKGLSTRIIVTLRLKLWCK